MKSVAAVVALAAVLFAGSVHAMTVQEFLDEAADIPRNPTAMLRSDTRRLMNEVQQSFAVLRREQTEARAAGRAPATCMPERVSLNPEHLLARFQAIPAPRRNISVTQALREWMAERHPCPANSA